jgi:hypothetical protein
VLDGNLVITGTSTSLETINSAIKDNIIILNNGEVGAGVTQGTSGIEIERGSLNNATLLFNESSDVWEAKIGSSFSIVRGATPVNSNDLVTKEYVDLATTPALPFDSIQFNNSGSFAGSSKLRFNGTQLLIDNISLTSNTISTTAGNLVLLPIGTVSVESSLTQKAISSPSTPVANTIVTFVTASGTTPNREIAWKLKNQVGDEIIISSVLV